MPLVQRARRAPFPLAIGPALIVTLGLLAACGGDGSVTDPTQPPLDPDGGLDPEVREAVFESMEAFLDSLPAGDPDAIGGTIAQRLASFDAIIDAGVGHTPGSAWAIFADSTLYMVMNGGFPPEEDPAAGATGPTAAPAISALAGQIAATADPTGASTSSGPRYRLLNGLGEAFDNWDPRVTLAGMLNGHGYTGTIETASLDHLRNNMSGVEILYFRTHGAQATLRATDETLGALWTTTARNRHREATDVQLFGDMRARRVGWATQYDARGVGGPQNPTRARTHYMITDRFIQEYWGEMKPNALVYLDACEAGHYETIIGAFAHLRATALVGWTRVVRASKFATTTPFVFDRLLGANAFLAEDPPQRPFDLEAVFARHIGPGKGYGYDAGTGGELIHSLARSGPFILTPSIQRMEVDEVGEELIIHGLFPESDEDVEVSVGELSLAVENRSRTELVATLPTHAAGEVVVRMQRSGGWIESNERPLTEWTGDFRYRIEHNYFDAAGLGAATADCRLTYRADLHDYREEPAQEPIEAPVTSFTATRDSNCELVFSGTVVGEGCAQLSFVGTTGLGWMDPKEAPEIWPNPDWDPYPWCGSDFVTFGGQIDAETGEVEAELRMFGCGRIIGQIQGTSQCFDVDHDWPLIVFPDVLHAPIELIMDEDGNIPPGERGTGGGPSGGAWLEWGEITARFPPDPGVTLARAASGGSWSAVAVPASLPLVAAPRWSCGAVGASSFLLFGAGRRALRGGLQGQGGGPVGGRGGPPLRALPGPP